MQHDYFQKKKFLPFNSTPGDEDVCKDRKFACIVLYAQFPDMHYDYFQKKRFYLLAPPKGPRTWLCLHMDLYAPFDMKHDYFINFFDLLITPQGPRICCDWIVLFASFPLIWCATWLPCGVPSCSCAKPKTVPWVPVGQKMQNVTFSKFHTHKTSLFLHYFKRSETWHVFKEQHFNLSILVFIWSPFVTDTVSFGHNNNH